MSLYPFSLNAYRIELRLCAEFVFLLYGFEDLALSGLRLQVVVANPVYDLVGDQHLVREMAHDGVFYRVHSHTANPNVAAADAFLQRLL